MYLDDFDINLFFSAGPNNKNVDHTSTPEYNVFEMRIDWIKHALF